MNGFKLFVFILVSCFAASLSSADIYEWTDENGLKHYTNQAPPSGSRLLMITKEEPYDEAADRARMEAEQQERLELARLEIAQREEELKLREAEAQRRLAEADHLAKEAMREDVYYLDEAYSRNRVIYSGGGFRSCRGDRGDCNSLNYNRWYYRTGNRRATHPNKLNHRTPYQNYRYIKKPYGSDRKIQHNRYRGQIRPHPNTRYRQKGQHPTYKLNTRSTNNYNIYRRYSTGSRSGKFNGRGNFSRGRLGFGMRR